MTVGATPSTQLLRRLKEAERLQQSGRIREAESQCREILRTTPAEPRALHLLAVLLHQQGETDPAIDLLQRSARRGEPGHAVVFNTLGALLSMRGRLIEAAASFQQAIEARNDYVEAYVNLATALRRLGRFGEAVEACEIAILYVPDSAGAHFTKGSALLAQGRPAEAIPALRRAVELDPGLAEAHNNLGAALQSLRAIDAAEASFRAALAAKPNYAEAANNLGTILTAQGDPGGAADAFRQAIAARPDFAEAHSNLILCLQHLPEISAAELFAEHRRFAAQHEAPLRPGWRGFPNDRNSERRLRIGYVSADFHHHAAAYFIEPVLANHDHASFEIYAYYNSVRRDSVTERIESLVDHFVPCVAFSDDQLADRIRADRIDILLDLSSHSSGNRLTMFARKPAPIQITWVGCPGTTGLTAMDYRITGEVLDPPGLTEKYHTEELIRLRGSPAIFRPDSASPEVNELPALSAVGFTFSCLNRAEKINGTVAALWARILNDVPGSRLMLGNMDDRKVRDRVSAWFEEAGIDVERLQFQPRLSMAAYLALHHRIDLALDPFPYSGGTTTNYSLWMGVPVVTLAGERTISRCGAAILSRAGLPEFIAGSEDEYVGIATAFAHDLPRLAEIRQQLRARLAANPALDAAAGTRLLEEAYRQAWRRWCSENPSREAEPG